jgi:biopolymer transport protein TolQ
MDLASTAAGGDLSIANLFLRADWVVKGVILMLIAGSVWCWAVVIDKTAQLRRLHRQAGEAETALRDDRAVRTLVEEKDHSVGAILAHGWREWQRQTAYEVAESHAEFHERIERAMTTQLARELHHLEARLPFLATLGSAAPFLGLFGTVWGIMNSFTAIAHANNAGLSVVAPGIAEALMATAVGLVAAIPAVVAYNKLATEIRRFAGRLRLVIAEAGTRLAHNPQMEA